MKKTILTLAIGLFSLFAFGQSLQQAGFDSIVDINGTLKKIIVGSQTATDTVYLGQEIKKIKLYIDGCKGERDMWIARIREAQGRLAAYQKLKP